jgi:hypothetical protein
MDWGSRKTTKSPKTQQELKRPGNTDISLYGCYMSIMLLLIWTKSNASSTSKDKFQSQKNRQIAAGTCTTISISLLMKQLFDQAVGLYQKSLQYPITWFQKWKEGKAELSANLTSQHGVNSTSSSKFQENKNHPDEN